jgi:hypothetical protein
MPREYVLTPSARDRRELNQCEHLLDARRRDAGGEREHAQVVASCAAGMKVIRLEDRADAPGRAFELAVAAAED